MSGVEKRVHPRVPLVARVEGESGGTAFLAVAQNISSGGMLIATANPFPVGHTLALTFVLPGTEHRIRTFAVVRHVVENSGMGVQFQDLAPDALAKLQQFLRSQM
jgi:uncharacterized protein (TIGR02266 family)